MNWNKFNAGWGKILHLQPGFTHRDCEYMHFRDIRVRRNTFFQGENPFKTADLQL
jgi:hypothetical protein